MSTYGVKWDCLPAGLLFNQFQRQSLSLTMSQTISPIISAAQLAAINHQADVLVLDCRHDLMDHKLGLAAWRAGHIPGAVFFDMETDAAGEHTGQNGRHPLPSREQARSTFARLGLRDNMQLVVYDGNAGMYAARVWWMARWIGFKQVQLLSGGLAAWLRQGGELLGPALTAKEPAAGQLTLRPALNGWVDANQLQHLLASETAALIDARAPARYSGETEPLDPVAGHIPSAINRFYQDNLTPEGLFKPAAQLRNELARFITDQANQVVHQCGSGVTACHNMIAQELAGLGSGLLYPGSWSEWCADPKRPVATGPSPGSYPRK
jgi:thiosulfate/3-mercaptopyruvate sulfurtransferase